jgi:hypothetical protein
MLHTIKKIENKTSFLNKSYMLDLSAEMKRGMNFASFIHPRNTSAVGFARHPPVVFILRGGDPRGAEQRQAGEEIEEGHQPQHRSERRPGGDFTSAGSVQVMTILMISKPIAAISVPRNRALRRGRWRGSRQKIQKKQIVGENGDGEADQPPGGFQPFNIIEIQRGDNHLLGGTRQR